MSGAGKKIENRAVGADCRNERPLNENIFRQFFDEIGASPALQTLQVHNEENASLK